MPKSSHPISWFEHRQGQIVKRNGRIYKLADDKDAAQYYFELQEEGMNFAEAPAQKPRISFAANSLCTACEG